MRPIRREGLMHGYFRDRRSDTTDAITVEGGRVVMRVRRKPLEMDFHDRKVASDLSVILADPLDIPVQR